MDLLSFIDIILSAEVPGKENELNDMALATENLVEEKALKEEQVSAKFARLEKEYEESRAALEREELENRMEIEDKLQELMRLFALISPDDIPVAPALVMPRLPKVRQTQSSKGMPSCKEMDKKDCEGPGRLMGCRWKQHGRSKKKSCGQTRTLGHEGFRQGTSEKKRQARLDEIEGRIGGKTSKPSKSRKTASRSTKPASKKISRTKKAPAKKTRSTKKAPAKKSKINGDLQAKLDSVLASLDEPEKKEKTSGFTRADLSKTIKGKTRLSARKYLDAFGPDALHDVCETYEGGDKYCLVKRGRTHIWQKKTKKGTGQKHCKWDEDTCRV